MKISREELLGAIHKKCMDCSGHSRHEVEHCLVLDCYLYPYRSPKAIQMLEEREANQQEKPQQMSMLQVLE